MSTLDDLSLIRLFVQGNACLKSNQHLRIQPADNDCQLIGQHGQWLAVAQLRELPPTVCIRKQTDYAELLQKVLLVHDYVPVGCDAAPEVCRYEYHPTPAGYELRYTQARELWKSWWTRRRHLQRQAIQTDLLIFTQREWYPIRDIILNQGTLFLKTYLGETAHQGDDWVVWLDKDQAEETQYLPARPTAAVRSSRQNESTAADPASLVVPLPPPPIHRVPAPVAQPSPPGAAVKNPNPPKLLEDVVRHEPGRLCIRTSLGDVIVEGDHLRCYLDEASPSSPQPEAMARPVRVSLREWQG
ncbi:hypothetical protein XM38_012560 [Halomicronema hongdechloris C2206]|uniref:Uncharacterized protein n=1 Tax=Halomicronema hongdechloris C2206 TaxID=1641165 RepID=A0A1Z3HJ41_9CYAN|nr:hypothetical protein [Halomicronema hongdechloris]ASC70318.1 hypothetical protein XM38_012560 [Halomicronema hongdechloris C2206]